MGWIRASSYLKQALEEGKEYQMFKLGSDMPKFMVYRRVYITNTIGFVLNFGTDGAIKIIPFGGNIPVDMGFNFSEVYICAWLQYKGLLKVKYCIFRYIYSCAAVIVGIPEP